MLIGVDVGTVRVGVATIKSPSTIAFPHAIWSKAQNKAEQEILKLIGREPVEAVVVGLPLDEEGRETAMCQTVRSFCHRLSKRTDKEIYLIDESGSSEEARARMQVSKGELEIDAFAACIILERYVNRDDGYDRERFSRSAQIDPATTYTRPVGDKGRG